MIWSRATAIAGLAVDQHRRRDLRVRNLFFWGSLDFETERVSTVPITAHPWLLSVTESFALPPKKAVVCPIFKNSICESGSYPQYCCRFFWVC